MSSSQTKVKPSRFCYIFRRGGIIGLFQTLNVKIAYLNETQSGYIVEKFNRGDIFDPADVPESEKQTFEQLISLGMLVSLDTNEESRLAKISRQYTEKPDISLMYLILTENCNLSCRYCFIENGFSQSYHPINMTSETAFAAIDLFIKHVHVCEHPDHKPAIIFYGGEPTLNWDVFKAAVCYIEEKIVSQKLPQKTNVSIITNGTRLDKQKLSFIKEHDIGFSLSFDGPNSSNNERIFSDGSQSTPIVMKSYDLAREHEIPVGISCTVTSTNLGHLHEVTQWLCNEKVSSVGFNIQLDIPKRPVLSDQLVRKISVALTESYEVLRSQNIYEDRIGRKVKAFTDQSIYPFDCGGYGSQFVVAPDGSVGPCHAYLGERKYFVTNVHSANDFDPKTHPVFLEWSRRSPLNMPQCYDCPVLGICGGGCAKSAELRHGTIWGLDDRFCIHAKHTLEWMIWDLFDIISGTEDSEGFQSH